MINVILYYYTLMKNIVLFDHKYLIIERLRGGWLAVEVRDMAW